MAHLASQSQLALQPFGHVIHWGKVVDQTTRREGREHFLASLTSDIRPSGTDVTARYSNKRIVMPF